MGVRPDGARSCAPCTTPGCGAAVFPTESPFAPPLIRADHSRGGCRRRHKTTGPLVGIGKREAGHSGEGPHSFQMARGMDDTQRQTQLLEKSSSRRGPNGPHQVEGGTEPHFESSSTSRRPVTERSRCTTCRRRWPDCVDDRVRQGPFGHRGVAPSTASLCPPVPQSHTSRTGGLEGVRRVPATTVPLIGIGERGAGHSGEGPHSFQTARGMNDT